MGHKSTATLQSILAPISWTNGFTFLTSGSQTAPFEVRFSRAFAYRRGHSAALALVQPRFRMRHWRGLAVMKEIGRYQGPANGRAEEPV
jgi:hypothetical protein